MNNNFENHSTFCFKNYNNSYKKEKKKKGDKYEISIYEVIRCEYKVLHLIHS